MSVSDDFAAPDIYKLKFPGDDYVDVTRWSSSGKLTVDITPERRRLLQKIEEWFDAPFKYITIIQNLETSEREFYNGQEAPLWTTDGEKEKIPTREDSCPECESLAVKSGDDSSV